MRILGGRRGADRVRHGRLPETFATASLQAGRRAPLDSRRLVLRLRLALLLLALAACGGVEPSPDGGPADAGAPDSGAVDSGLGGGGGSDAGTGGGTGGGAMGPNHPPVVAASITAPVTSGFSGQLLDLSIAATDEDFDVLTVTWTGPGTFVTPASPKAVRWYSPLTTTLTTYTLSVSVTDGRSPAASRTVTVTITPPRFQDVYGRILGVPALSGGQCAGCHGAMGQYSVGSTAAQGWTNVVDAPHHRGSGCTAAGLSKLVVPGDLDHSLLYRKMRGTQPMGCGDEMPRGAATAALEWQAIAVNS